MLNFLKKTPEPKYIDFAFVGLGNPGNQYAKTRHNIGWMAVERFAESLNAHFEAGKGKYYQAFAKYAGKQIILVIPTTYMNNSGEAVDFIIKKFGIKAQNIAILVDEYNFPIGKIHVKKGGSGGGHNGTTSVIQHIGGDFIRMRLGIDRNFGQGELVNYVLSNFEENEIEKVNEILDNSTKAMQHIIKAGFQRAMSEINSGKLFE